MNKEQATVRIFQNENNWWFVEMRWSDDNSHSWGFPDRVSATNAIQLVQYCIRNDEKMELVTIEK